MSDELRAVIERAWDERDSIGTDTKGQVRHAVDTALAALDRGDARIDCPCHDGRFDPSNGRVLAGPPPRPLPKIELVERQGGIYAVGIGVSTVG